MKNVKYFVILCICSIIISCTIQLYKPSSKDATIQQELVDGRKLYINHCGNCHNLHLPKEYNAGEWANHLNDMQRKSKITDLEKEHIYKYLTSHP